MGNATVEINTNLLGANDLLLGEGRVLQRRYGQDVSVQKLNLSLIPGTDAFPQFTKVLLKTLQLKVDSEPGKGLSSNDFSDAEKAKLATISGASFVGVYSAAASALSAWEGVRAASLEIFATKEQIEQSALSAEEKLAAVRTEATAALELLQETAAEGVDAVGIAKQSALIAVGIAKQSALIAVVDKQNIATTTVESAANVAVLRIEQTKDGARTSISGLAQELTDGLISVRRNILDDIEATASDALDDISTKIDDADAAAALAVSKTATLNTAIDTANAALIELHSPQTDLKLLYVSASGALYTAAAQSAFTEVLIQRAIESLHTYAASVYAAEAEADRVEIVGYKTDITAMMVQMQILLDNTKTAEQNAEFIALKEAFD